MKHFIFLFLLLSTSTLYAQSPDFVKAFNASKDTNFVLYGTRWDVSSNVKEIKILKDFYIVDYKTIRTITNTWFLKPDDSAFFMCTDDYSVVLKQNNTVIWSGSVNLDCGTSLIGNQTYWLPKNTFSVLNSHALYMKQKDSTFTYIEDGRAYYNNLKKNKNIFIDDLYWFKYDGYTVFEYVVMDSSALDKEVYFHEQLNSKLKELQNVNNMYAYCYLTSSSETQLTYVIYCYFKESNKLDAIGGLVKTQEWKKFTEFKISYYLKMKRHPSIY